MAITDVAYCTREDVQRALNLADSVRLNQRVDTAVQAGARDVEGALHRRFYPETKTVMFNQPEGVRLWLYEEELAAAPTQIISGDQLMTVDTDVFLRPKSGPPYRWLEVSYAGEVFWQSLDTPQNAIEITGVYNYPVATITATTLGASVATGSTATMQLADSSQVGVGHLVLVDSERMLVSDKTLTTTGATLAADLGGNKNNTTATVNNGALINPGELILIDGERMFVENVAGNTLVLSRAENASTLAAHTSGATIYAPRLATVQRGKFGTTATSHASGSTISLLQAPALIRELNLAFAINNVSQSLSAYARSIGSGDNQRDQSGRGVADILADAYTAYGRKARGRAV